MQEHSCLLAQAHLCDGHQVLTQRPGLTDPCWCGLLSSQRRLGDEQGASATQTARARAVARAQETVRVVEQRRRFSSAGSSDW